MQTLEPLVWVSQPLVKVYLLKCVGYSSKSQLLLQMSIFLVFGLWATYSSGQVSNYRQLKKFASNQSNHKKQVGDKIFFPSKCRGVGESLVCSTV